MGHLHFLLKLFLLFYLLSYQLRFAGNGSCFVKSFKKFSPLFLHSYVILCRYALDARLAIAITANFVNNWYQLLSLMIVEMIITIWSTWTADDQTFKRQMSGLTRRIWSKRLEVLAVNMIRTSSRFYLDHHHHRHHHHHHHHPCHHHHNHHYCHHMILIFPGGFVQTTKRLCLLHRLKSFSWVQEFETKTRINKSANLWSSCNKGFFHTLLNSCRKEAVDYQTVVSYRILETAFDPLKGEL